MIYCVSIGNGVVIMHYIYKLFFFMQRLIVNTQGRCVVYRECRDHNRHKNHACTWRIYTVLWGSHHLQLGLRQH